ncbi:MAG: hypothetical protein A2V88_15310 [Elusimicrobia bacterium RBG_16_66_12]|nr:MAG: hypothetical protein A2V88_15310 [Elusimicrobia bacterium RBG_16_66_12]
MTQPKIDWESLGKAAGERERHTRPGIKETRPLDWRPGRGSKLRAAVTEDMTGKVFGLLTVLRQAPSDGCGTRWKVRCECGDERILRRGDLVRGVVTHRSCGKGAA